MPGAGSGSDPRLDLGGTVVAEVVGEVWSETPMGLREEVVRSVVEVQGVFLTAQ